VRAIDAESARATPSEADAEWDDEEGETRVAHSASTTAAARAASTPAARPPISTTVVAPPSATPRTARTGDTVVGPMPTRASESASAAVPSEETTEPARRRDDVVGRVEPSTARREPSAEPRPSESSPGTAPAARARTLDDRGPRRAAEPVALPDADLDLGPEQRKGGVLGALILVLLLVIAVGLTLASVLRNGTPDARPLLEDLYRQYLQR